MCFLVISYHAVICYGLKLLRQKFLHPPMIFFSHCFFLSCDHHRVPLGLLLHCTCICVVHKYRPYISLIKMNKTDKLKLNVSPILQPSTPQPYPGLWNKLFQPLEEPSAPRHVSHLDISGAFTVMLRPVIRVTLRLCNQQLCCYSPRLQIHPACFVFVCFTKTHYISGQNFTYAYEVNML